MIVKSESQKKSEEVLDTVESSETVLKVEAEGLGEGIAKKSVELSKTPTPTPTPKPTETPVVTEEVEEETSVVIEETPEPTEEPVVEEPVIVTEEPIIEETPVVTEEPVVEYPSTYAGDFTVTFYCPCPECCNSWIGAMGIELTPGWSVAMADLPLGTIIEVEGFGTYRVEDISPSGICDIFVSHHSEIPSWGMTTASVYIVG